MILVGSVAEVFVVAHRGVGVIFEEPPRDLIGGMAYRIAVGSAGTLLRRFDATCEFVLQSASTGVETTALLVRNATGSDVPVGAVVFRCSGGDSIVSAPSVVTSGMMT